MALIILTWVIRKKGLLVIFLVLGSLFNSENLLSKKEWTKDYVEIEWVPEIKAVLITLLVYDYSFGAQSVSGFLLRCKLEASVKNRVYHKLMNIHTKSQIKRNTTEVYLYNKLANAKVQFLKNIFIPSLKAIWFKRRDILVRVWNEEDLAMVTFIWYVSKYFEDITHIRVQGKWCTDPPNTKQGFSDIIYLLDKTSPSKLKSYTPDLNTTIYDNNSVVVLKNSETITIKGANLGANIKVYNTSGVVIKSVISNNDVVQIALPAKQIYFVHVGTSRYKVAL